MGDFRVYKGLTEAWDEGLRLNLGCFALYAVFRG